MNQDLLKILSDSNKDIDNQKLMNYLSGKLSEQEKHEVEEWMSSSDFAGEAMEGLQNFNRNEKLESYVASLNRDLNKYLQQKKKRRENRKIRELNGGLVAVLVIILLIILAYIVISRLKVI